MAELKITCSRCGIEVDGHRDEHITIGFYDVRPTDSPSGWDKFANPGETEVCSPCMWRDPRYQAVHGDQAARSLEAQQRPEDAQESVARRLRFFSVTPEVFLCLGSGKFEVIANPLPGDAALVGAFYSELQHAFIAVVRSLTFDPVEDDVEIPHLPSPVIRRLQE